MYVRRKFSSYKSRYTPARSYVVKRKYKPKVYTSLRKVYSKKFGRRTGVKRR